MESTTTPQKVEPREVCILGYAEETRDLVFSLGKHVNIWGINAAHFFSHRNDSEGGWLPQTQAMATDWFQMHPRNWRNPKGETTNYFGRPVEHLQFLQQFQGNVWLQKADPEIPNAKVYPLEQIIKAAGRRHFTSTFAYQAALLWYQHVVQGIKTKTLHILGVNLSSIDEYIHQKSCVEYWLGRLEEAGIQLEIPAGSALLKGKLYATDSGGDLSDHAFERLQYWKNKYMEHWANVNTAVSMKEDTRYWASKLSEISEKHKDQFTEELKADIQSALDNRVKVLTQLSDKGSAEINGALGMVKDNQHWLSLTGGFDHRAPQLPDLRLPMPHMATDIALPEAKSI